MSVFAWALIGYASGCLPSTWIVARVAKKGHVLSNVRRTVGEADAHLLLKRDGGRAATFAAVLDVFKGFIPVLAASLLSQPHEVAACAIGTVAGHCWPPFLLRFAGRGLAAAAGAFLGFLPLEMTVAGVVRLAGGRLRMGGLASTVGFAAIPVVAFLRGQPMPYVVAAIAANVLISARRLEGVTDDVELGISLGRAVVRRVVLDASAYAGRGDQTPL